MTGYPRDLAAYGATPPDPRWPGGTPVGWPGWRSPRAPRPLTAIVEPVEKRRGRVDLKAMSWIVIFSGDENSADAGLVRGCI